MVLECVVSHLSSQGVLGIDRGPTGKERPLGHVESEVQVVLEGAFRRWTMKVGVLDSRSTFLRVTYYFEVNGVLPKRRLPELMGCKELLCIKYEPTFSFIFIDP